MLTKNDLHQIKTIIDKSIGNSVQPLTKEIKSLRKTQELMIKDFDMMLGQHHQRLNRLEDHAGLPHFVSQ